MAKSTKKQDKLEQQKDHFNKISQDYYTHRQKATHLLFKDLLWGYFFGRNKDKFPKRKVALLEAMSGHCEGKTLYEKFVSEDVDYSGFDYSEEMVKIAKDLYPKADIFWQDVTKFKVKNKYDVVIIIGGLHHVYNFVEESMQNIAGSIKPGGHFIVLEPTNNSKIVAKIRERVYNKNEFFDEETEHDFRLKEYNDMMYRSGLDIVDQVYPGLLGYVLFYNPDAFKWLRIGGKGLVKFMFWLEKPLFSRWPGKKFSFCTLTLLRKRG